RTEMASRRTRAVLPGVGRESDGGAGEGNEARPAVRSGDGGQVVSDATDGQPHAIAARSPLRRRARRTIPVRDARDGRRARAGDRGRELELGVREEIDLLMSRPDY